MLAERGCKVTVVPAQTPAREVLALKPDGIFLSNGPGDPEPCDYAIEAIRELIDSGHPDLRHLPRPPAHRPGLGREDAQDEVRPPRRQPSGEGPRHRPGADHQPEPRLRGRRRRRCRPTCASTHVSLFDGTLQGLARTDRPAFCFQGHPEASPGPHDIGYLFDRFVDLMDSKTEMNDMPKRTDIKTHPDHRRRPDRHRPGLRVRLLRRAGLQGAARGGLPRRPGQLQSGDDHDRPGDGRRRPTSSRSPGRWSRRSSPRSGPTRCCRRWAARPRSTARSTCARHGVLEKYGVELIGASREAIDKAEDREMFKEAMTRIGLGSRALGHRAHARGGAATCRRTIGFPAVIRPSFTLGGTGGGIAYNREEFDRRSASAASTLSPTQRAADRGIAARLEGVRDGGGARHARTTASSSARSRTSTRWACTPATRSPSRRRRR